VSIPDLLPEHRISALHTCDGKDLPLPVQWSGVPHGTAELALFILNLRPVHEGLFFDWAVAGLSATSYGISSDTLPSGAVVGRNSLGKVSYSICPAKGTHETYIVRLVALSHPIAAQSGFDAEALYREAERSTKFVGLAGGTYERR
jgi:phosphatidylethanolamine-binding protein (PEBP) family uncharacterized protein